MGKNKDLLADEKVFITRWLGNGQSTLQISKKLSRDHRTIQAFVNNCTKTRVRSDRGKSRTVNGRQMTLLKREMAKNPLSTSKSVFKKAGVLCNSRATRCRTLQKVAKMKSASKQPPLKEHHKKARLAWAKKYMKTDFSKVIFTDECRANLDGPDSFSRGWLLANQAAPVRVRRQQGGGGVMFWAAIHGGNLIGPFRIEDGVKMNSMAYTTLLTNNLLPVISSMPSKDRKKLIWMQDNAPSHASSYSKEFLKGHGFKGNKLMDWPACSPDLNPIENYWSSLKRVLYADGKQFSSRDELWLAILDACRQLDQNLVKSLTQSMDNRLVKVYQHLGNYIKH